ncbi:hypothetical protein BBJ29_001514 [Phytophthora kernoviae]|uniref:PDZ domain-containing protein n=1 Tax=Phytophthora kernoviae TaxID=325452 RepID=A0A3F2S1Q2_9STRA|nr:hypothetical protein BBJ29_001514 [Phytophthora kernoviae]RLN68616.1 hypothetical protein BBP00_00000885 [Phytophthora kernoviae]
MSFFTLNSTADFQQNHQQVGDVLKLKSNPSSPSSAGKPSGKNEEHREPLSTPGRVAGTLPLTPKAVSELDPLSALNLSRAADPWLGNTLLTPTACSYLDSAEGASASAIAAASLKVVAVDGPDSDEDWGDFVTFLPREQERKQLVESTTDDRASKSESGNSGKHNLKLANNEQSRDRYASGPSWNSSSMGLRNNTPTHAASPRQSLSKTDWYGRQAVVKGFRSINAAGDEGPAKRCGLIRVGDVLTAIDGESCLEMDFQETLEALRRAGKSRHTLHFKSLEAAGDLSIYASDKDLVQARAFINQHKQRFYRPPPLIEGAAAHEMVNGCIERLRGEFVTALNFHREETGEFLLSASCASDGSGPFIFHTLRDSHLRTMRELPQSEDSAVYLGLLEPSFLGTEFTLFDHHTSSDQQYDNELAFLVYSANVLGRVPNSLKCVVSKPAQLDQVEDDQEDVCQHKPITVGQQRSGMGSDGAVFNTHSTRSGPSASLSDRYNRLQQSRRVPVAERLRSFTLDDLDERFGVAADEALSWLDDDDVENQARAMRVREARMKGNRTASMGQIAYGAVEQNEYQKDLLVFETKQPSWNEELGAWTLNFQGRVKVASKKNFLLVATETNDSGEEEEITVLRFGKVSKTRFTLDYAAPMAPIQALAVACSAFANKMAVT